jgi:hypothetical protein
MFRKKRVFETKIEFSRFEKIVQINSNEIFLVSLPIFHSSMSAIVIFGDLNATEFHFLYYNPFGLDLVIIALQA